MNHVPSIQALIGESISYVWFSDYSICYLELGVLKEGRKLPNGRNGRPNGEITVFLGYDWNAEIGGMRRSRLELHSSSLERDSFAEQLHGAIIQSVELMAETNEIELRFSSGMTLRTSSDVGEVPSWGINFERPVQGHLCVINQALGFVAKCLNNTLQPTPPAELTR